MSNAAFVHQHRVTYSECTVGNHIYYARYLNLLEEARGEMFRHLGKTFLEWQNEDLIFPVIECNLVYKHPARYDDLLAIHIHITQLAGVRLGFRYAIQRLPDGALILEAETRHVCANLNEKPKRLPALLIEHLQPFTIRIDAD